MPLNVLKPKPPGRSDERVALGDAIEELRASVARREALTRALADAEAAATAAARAFEAAEAAVTETKEASARYLVDAAAGGDTGAAPPSTRAARNALEDARDELDARCAARDELRKRRAEPDNTDIYRMRVTRATDAVLCSEAMGAARAVIGAAQKARVDLAHGILLTQYLDGRGLFDRSTLDGLPLLSQWPIVGDWDRERPQATARWRSAIEALQADPDAALDL